MENTAARRRKQVPEGYLIVGIDPHKKRHAAVAITQDFTIQAVKSWRQRKCVHRVLDANGIETFVYLIFLCHFCSP